MNQTKRSTRPGPALARHVGPNDYRAECGEHPEEDFGSFPGWSRAVHEADRHNAREHAPVVAFDERLSKFVAVVVTGDGAVGLRVHGQGPQPHSIDLDGVIATLQAARDARAQVPT